MLQGVDIDVEETVRLEDVQKLITKLDEDFGRQFILTMAPLAGSLAADEPGMGGFCYKDLWNTPQGQRINWFNGQFYDWR